MLYTSQVVLITNLWLTSQVTTLMAFGSEHLVDNILRFYYVFISKITFSTWKAMYRNCPICGCQWNYVKRENNCCLELTRTAFSWKLMVYPLKKKQTKCFYFLNWRLLGQRKNKAASTVVHFAQEKGTLKSGKILNWSVFCLTKNIISSESYKTNAWRKLTI